MPRSARRARPIIQAPWSPDEGPELILGLVGAVGTDLKRVHGVLGAELAKVGYTVDRIRLSELLTGIKPYKSLPDAPADARYEAYMSAGTDFRTKLGRGDAVGLLAMGAIGRRRRQIVEESGGQYARRHAFVLHSLKRPEEIQTLRRIYGPSFYVISAYSARSKRIDILSEEIARTRHESDISKYRDIAERIIRRDEEEIGTKFGQNVREAFPLADLFISADTKKQIVAGLNRFIEILFEYPFHTPTVDELSMFMARAAALRSADLSRQVGAVIVSEEGEVLSTGCNDVPKAGGGIYWPGDVDNGDFQLGVDPSAEAKADILAELLNRMREAGWLNSRRTEEQTSELLRKALYGDESGVTKGSRLMGLLEFGRVVHAEMAAITDAARRGISVKGGVLFTTTFPCHICARHIIASGIKRVVYIEPYPKSMAGELYPDSILVDGPSDQNKVQFGSFVGVAPRRFMELFDMPRRKDDFGHAIEWKAATANPRVRRLEHTYVIVELSVMKFLGKAVRKSGLLS